MAPTPNTPIDPAAAVIVRCAWCGRNRDRAGGWRDAPVPAATVSHGICPPCFEAQTAERAAWSASRGTGGR